MRTSFKTFLAGLLALTLVGAIAYEIFLFFKYETETTEALLAADEKIGSDSRSRHIIAFQQTYKEDIEMLQSFSITKADLVTIADELEKTGRALGLIITISSITTDSRATDKNQSVRVSVDATGAWGPSLNFVHIIESLPYKYQIEKMDLRKEGELWRISSTIKLTTISE